MEDIAAAPLEKKDRTMVHSFADSTLAGTPAPRRDPGERRGVSPTCAKELQPAPNPWHAAKRLAGLPHFLFLDSALGHPRLSRYSFLTGDPFEWIVARGKRVTVSGQVVETSNPFDVLAERLARYAAEPIDDLPPFQGGAAGLFGYDLCHHIERLPTPRYNEFQVPDLAIGLYDWVLAFDHIANRAWIVSTGFPEIDPRRQCQRAEQRIDELKYLLRGSEALVATRGLAAPVEPASVYSIPDLDSVRSSFDRGGYLNAVRRAIEYVHAGDCFQVNIAQRLLHPTIVHPFELYGRLRQCNPAPFASYFDLGDYVIASASPERFLRVERGEVETRPIKGTRPRGATPTVDQARKEELLGSAKDRAENVMIVDLLRNDLGRVCRYGSVRVADVCRLETYPFVHHLVSEVRGRLRDDKTPIDLLRAAFPGGSVTGAPKVRAMEIIAELEPVARGPYCGSLGYVGFDGSMDTNILIRTFTIGGGWMQFPVGGGIVADSLPEREYDETWHKARGLLRALK